MNSVYKNQEDLLRLEKKLNEQGEPTKEDIEYMKKHNIIASRLPVSYVWKLRYGDDRS